MDKLTKPQLKKLAGEMLRLERRLHTEGKLTDVMPGVQQLGAGDTGGQQQTTPGNVYNIFLGGSRRRKQADDPLAFLLDYINPLRTSTTQQTAMFNPYEVLSSTLNAQPRFYG